VSYEPLASLFYKDSTSDRFSNAEVRTKMRLEAESTFRTGIMTPDGELFLAIPRELSLLTEMILRYERKIAAGMRSLPPVALGAMVRDLVINEVVSTNELEGVYSTRRQIDELLRPEREFDDPFEKKRFRELAKLYLALSDQEQLRPQHPEDIRAIYNKVMDGEPLSKKDLPDGKLFRRGRVDIIGTGGRVIHEGLYPESVIIDAVKQMLDLANSEEIPQLLSACLAHYVFEYVHPFYDGNGRTGRYLLALHLSAPRSCLTTLSWSRAIAQNRNAYYRSFRDAEHPLNHGELTFFVMNLLDLIQLAQAELDEKMVQKQGLLGEAKNKLDGFVISHGLGEKDAGIVYMLAQLRLFAAFPEASQEEIADYIGLGKQRTRDYTKRLQEKGILEAVSRRPLRLMLSDAAAAELGLP